ncbi:Bug family tripartite tricarboxylate transporter substrate binding protein [Halomonas salipaludis]|uniref:Bug family tripartite tricarboxylate transporter substrate binding protein n=1 Tax=Halomonas salipaludis TaxID=2032625 RepID=UPI001E5F3944|nr:tripartite tricarboxylate transporter substrate binding protein [Halomonas salipaludis]
MKTRHTLMAAAALATFQLAAVFTPVVAEEFPTRPVSLVVPWPAGGAYDLAARLMAEYAPEAMSQPLVVTNVTGAAGSTGVRHVADAAPDGYTVGMMGTHAIAQSYMNPNATPLDELEPLVFIGPEPASLAVGDDTGIESIEEYLELLRDMPGGIVNGNDSPGGFSYIAASMLENRFDVDLTKIPYQGYAPTVSALLSGEVMSVTLPIPLLADQHAAGAVRLLGVAAEERHPFAPDVPTFKEQGFDFIAEDFFMLYLPQGVPEARRDRLEQLFYELLNDDGFLQEASELGLVITPMARAATESYLNQRSREVHAILEESGLLSD